MQTQGEYPGLESSGGRGTLKLLTQYFRQKTMIAMFIGELGKFLSSSDPHQVFFLTLFSDMLSGIRILFHTLSAILSGIQSGISSGFFCG